MAEIIKPSTLNVIWAEHGDKFQPTDAKYDLGWVIEIPPHEYFNYIDNRQDKALAHINQHGIVAWDSVTEYIANKSYVQGSNGRVYRAKQTNTNKDPVTDTTQTYWEAPFIGSTDDYGVDTGTANAYVVNYPNINVVLVDGFVVRFKAANANTGTSTFRADGLAAKTIRGLAEVALQGGEIATGSIVTLVYKQSIDSWVLLSSTGGSIQIANATKSQHAITLSQTQALITASAVSGSQLYYMGQF